MKVKGLPADYWKQALAWAKSLNAFHRHLVPEDGDFASIRMSAKKATAMVNADVDLIEAENEAIRDCVKTGGKVEEILATLVCLRFLAFTHWCGFSRDEVAAIMAAVEESEW